MTTRVSAAKAVTTCNGKRPAARSKERHIQIVPLRVTRARVRQVRKADQIESTTARPVPSESALSEPVINLNYSRWYSSQRARHNAPKTQLSVLTQDDFAIVMFLPEEVKMQRRWISVSYISAAAWLTLAICALPCTSWADTVAFDFQSGASGASATPFDETVGLTASFRSPSDPGAFAIDLSPFATFGGMILDSPGPSGQANVSLVIDLSAPSAGISLPFATLGAGASEHRRILRARRDRDDARLRFRHGDRSGRVILVSGRHPLALGAGRNELRDRR